MQRRAKPWKTCAASLALAVPAERLHPEARAWAESRPRGERWCVAFSGGADSLALLLLLWAHWPDRRSRLVALHFDHRLRGAESRADAEFCRNVCRALGVKWIRGQWKDGPKVASEAAARAARFEFFEREMRRLRARSLWFGHQQDDIAETILMRLARGSGTAGLAAPRPVHPRGGGRIHLRPLLTLKKAELVAGLRGAGCAWREDSSNTGSDYFRNRVRSAVIPGWNKASGRDAIAGAAMTRELLAEDDAALEAWLNRVDCDGPDGALSLAALNVQPRAIARRALYRWLGAQENLGELSRQGFERLLAAVELGAATRQSLGSDAFAVIRKGRLVLERRAR